MASPPQRTMTTAQDAPSPAPSPGDEGRRLELVEEELRARTASVETGALRIRKRVVTEMHTIQVPVRREEVIIERRPLTRHAADQPEDPAGALLAHPEAAEVRDLQPGETLRIPVIEEEVVVQTRPVVVEEVVVGKRLVEEARRVEGSLRREEARVQTRGDLENPG